ncbi:hypothetical protein AB0876_19615 [Mycobacterium sp. NPDC049093]
MAVDNRLEELLDNHRPDAALRERVDERQFASCIPRAPARFPRVRLGRRWVSGLWLVLLGAVALVVVVFVAQQLRHYGWMQDFLTRYPGTSTSYALSVTTGFPAWLRWQSHADLIGSGQWSMWPPVSDNSATITTPVAPVSPNSLSLSVFANPAPWATSAPPVQCPPISDTVADSWAA